jgi:hypothetical protein
MNSEDITPNKIAKGFISYTELYFFDVSLRSEMIVT